MLQAVPDGGGAVAAEVPQGSGGRAGDDGIGLLCLPTLEHAGALEHEGAGLAANSSDHLLETYERGRAVAAVHHQVLGLPFPLDIPGVGPDDAGPSKSWAVRALTIGLLVPALDG